MTTLDAVPGYRVWWEAGQCYITATSQAKAERIKELLQFPPNAAMVAKELPNDGWVKTLTIRLGGEELGEATRSVTLLEPTGLSKVWLWWALAMIPTSPLRVVLRVWCLALVVLWAVVAL